MLAFGTIIFGSVVMFLALVAGPYIAVQFDYLAGSLPLGWFRFFGILMILFGLPLSVWCAYLLLVLGKDRAVPYDSPDGLSIAGPYKYIRNPFMLGWLFILWGEVAFLRSAPLLVYAIILTLCVHFWIIAFEEPSLENRYRDEYRKYKISVPRWMPRF